VLTDSTALQYLLSEQTNTSWLGVQVVTILGLPANEIYALFHNQTAPLGVTSATIYLQYACSVPQRKDAGSLIISIVIADLVFLGALRQLLAWVTAHWVSKIDPG
jgi:hypothetical protein